VLDQFLHEADLDRDRFRPTLARIATLDDADAETISSAMRCGRSSSSSSTAVGPTTRCRHSRFTSVRKPHRRRRRSNSLLLSTCARRGHGSRPDTQMTRRRRPNDAAESRGDPRHRGELSGRRQCTGNGLVAVDAGTTGGVMLEGRREGVAGMPGPGWHLPIARPPCCEGCRELRHRT